MEKENFTKYAPMIPCSFHTELQVMEFTLCAGDRELQIAGAPTRTQRCFCQFTLVFTDRPNIRKQTNARQTSACTCTC